MPCLRLAARESYAGANPATERDAELDSSGLDRLRCLNLPYLSERACRRRHQRDGRRRTRHQTLHHLRRQQLTTRRRSGNGRSIDWIAFDDRWFESGARYPCGFVLGAKRTRIDVDLLAATGAQVDVTTGGELLRSQLRAFNK